MFGITAKSEAFYHILPMPLLYAIEDWLAGLEFICKSTQYQYLFIRQLQWLCRIICLKYLVQILQSVDAQQMFVIFLMWYSSLPVLETRNTTKRHKQKSSDYNLDFQGFTEI